MNGNSKRVGVGLGRRIPAGTAGRQISTGSGEGRKGTARGCRSTGAVAACGSVRVQFRVGAYHCRKARAVPPEPPHIQSSITPATANAWYGLCCFNGQNRPVEAALSLSGMGGPEATDCRRGPIYSLPALCAVKHECHRMVPRQPIPIPTPGPLTNRDRFPKDRQIPPSDLPAVARAVPKGQLAGAALPNRVRTAWRKPAGSAPY